MADVLDIVARLRAWEAQQAVLSASTLQVAIQPHALVLTALALAGEDSTVHAAAIAGIGRRPRLLCVPDPRFRDGQYRLFSTLADVVEPYFQACWDAESYPQIWVSSAAA